MQIYQTRKMKLLKRADMCALGYKHVPTFITIAKFLYPTYIFFNKH